ncbi:S49 family peptidase [Chitinibacter sp. GC72]|uniref:S49 family peptidase n=1 Tax=Chitinibacter sp. GC72 TaxID=1526917 RepID=UPI001E62109F|nr:S49 family peptidase [Chitinibacter sp. GC72]
MILPQQSLPQLALPHLSQRLYNTPLLLHQPKLDVILSILGERIGLQGLNLNGFSELPKDTPSRVSNSIAVIPIYGTLVRRTVGLEAASGLLSYGEIGRQLDLALADPSVHGILLDMDSPGGEAGGLFELAERIRAASQIKPIWAHANDAAYSAAYALAAAAQRITLSPTAGVGSIGVIALHVDQSVRDEREGLRYTPVFAGAHKNDFSPHVALTPDAQSALADEVHRLYGMFVDHVGLMRQLSPQTVQETEARVFFAEAAVQAKLADAVCSYEQVLSEFARHLQAHPAAPVATSKATSNPISTRTIPMSQHTMLAGPEHEEDTDQDDANPTSAETDPDNTAPDPRSEALAIAETCLLAGVPQRTAEFLASNRSAAQVRQTLLNTRAEQTEISSLITPQAAASLPSAQNSPVVAAVKKLTSKD